MLKKVYLVLFITAIFSSLAPAQAGDSTRSKPVVVAVTERFTELDTLSGWSFDSTADRVRLLIYNSLVRVNANYEYVGELGDFAIDENDLSVAFKLRGGIKFHNGKILTAADVKYTFDALFAANGSRAANFYDSAPDKMPHLKRIETPDARTVVFRVARLELINVLLANLATIPIIPEGTFEQQKTSPAGTGAFRFVGFERTKSLLELEAFADHWEGAPKIAKLIVKSVSDAEALSDELRGGSVDLVFNPTILTPEMLENLAAARDLKVERFDGSNIQYIGFNTKAAPFDKVKVRQAVAYAIDREKIIETVFEGKAKLAHSILPEKSWAYAPGTKYVFDPAKARRLLKEAGYRGKAVKLFYAAGNDSTRRYAKIVQTMLKNVGFNVAIEAFEPQTLIEYLRSGKFQMNTSMWIGGNQNPIFYQDLFASENSPDKKTYGRNRGRYSNAEFDKIIAEAARTTDAEKARALYARAQEIVSRDVPLVPLWYPASVVVANRRIGNIKNAPDWSFIKTLE